MVLSTIRRLLVLVALVALVALHCCRELEDRFDGFFVIGPCTHQSQEGSKQRVII